MGSNGKQEGPTMTMATLFFLFLLALALTPSSATSGVILWIFFKHEFQSVFTTGPAQRCSGSLADQIFVNDRKGKLSVFQVKTLD